MKEPTEFFQKLPDGHIDGLFLNELSICPLGKVWVNCLKSLKKPSIYPLGKTPSAPSDKEEVDHVTSRVNCHRKDINEMSVDMRLVLKRLNRLEKKVWEQKDTIEALEGIIENQQTWMTRIRSCHCNEGANDS